MLAWRKTQPALAKGDFTLHETSDSVISYVRGHGDDSVFCAFNLGAEPATGRTAGGRLERDRAGLRRRDRRGQVELPPHQALFAERAKNSG